VLGTLPQRGVLVLVEEPRHQNSLVQATQETLPLCTCAFSMIK
jgi:hypothetical protein